MTSRTPLAIAMLAALLVAGTLAVTGCASHTDSTGDQPSHADAAVANAGDAVSDAWITTKVKGEIATTQGVPGTDVSVKTVDGVVTLAGVLPTDIAIDKAIAAARSVKGVKDVDASGLKARD